MNSKLSLLLALGALGWMISGCSRPPADASRESRDPKGPVARNEMGADRKVPTAPEMADPKNPAAEPPKIPKAATPNPENFVIKKTGEGNWQPARLDVAAFAGRVASAVAGLKGTYGEVITTIKTPAGNGQVKNLLKIQDDKTFSIQFLRVTELPSAGEIRADGAKKTMTKDDGVFMPSKPLRTPAADAALGSKALVQNWPKRFPRLLFLGLTDGKDPWKPLVQELASGKAGFKTEISQRTIDFRGKKLTNYRLIARRTPEQAKKLGPCDIEMVFDGARSLPVTIRVNFTEPGKKEWKILWQAGWNFQRKFDPKEFEIRT